jgi:hypothetical protein
VDLAPAESEYWFTLATSHYYAFEYAPCIAAFERCLALRPDYIEALSSMFYTRQMVCSDPSALCPHPHAHPAQVADWRERPELLARLLRLVDEQIARQEAPAVHPFHSLTYPITARKQLQIAAATALAEARRLEATVHTRW